MILRVPRFPVVKANACLDEMLGDQVFRDALYLASDVLFRELSRHDFQLSGCSQKMKYSLMKYHKRICYRPTPFGGFAGLAVCPFLEANNPGLDINKASFQIRVIEKERGDTNVSGEPHYRVNPFLYPYGSDFRLLAKGQNGSESTFVISEIYGSDLIQELRSVGQTISREDLVQIIRTNGIEEDENDFIQDLLELQIIIPHRPVKRSFPGPLVKEHKIGPGSSYDSFCSFSVAGSLPPGTEQQLRQGIACLDKLSNTQEPDALKEFKSRFEKLFDRREVPLLQALDPELGIDYDGLSTTSVSSTQNSQTRDNFPWSRVHELLLRKWIMRTGNGVPELKIHDEDLSELASPQKPYHPGMSMLFSVCDDKLHLKAAGGVSTLNMIGRFTVLDPQIRQLAKELGAIEMERNPDVLFAEISHIDNPDVASVKRKAIVYDYQIPFFEPPEVPDDFVIGLNDLYVSLRDNTLVLRSGRLNKRIIPRFSSAYNYQKSPLPVFRFLCDLLQEGVHANLNFSMQSLFPGMSAYPRVTYKDLILEAASWHLQAKELAGLKKLDQASRSVVFLDLANTLNLPEEFYYEVHDHLLHINRTSEQDICLLFNTIPATGVIVFREYFKSQESLVKDEKGNCYTHECIAFLTNREGSYVSGIESFFVEEHTRDHKKKLLPFDEWLYLKIYLHPAGYSDLLLNYIRPFISENIRKGNITSWFFISYYDDDFHLRLRLKQTKGRESYLLKSYRKLEGEIRQLSNLKKLELSTYFKETERYARIGIQAAEELFKISSEIVLSELAKADQIGDKDQEKLFSGIRHILIVCKTMNFDLAEVEVLTQRLTSHLTKSEKLEFDLEFRAQRKDLSQFLERNKERGILEVNYLNLLEIKLRPLKPNEKLQLVTDLNHMHLNRHFLYGQREKEMKTWYFVGKIGRSMGKFRSPPACRPGRLAWG